MHATAGGAQLSRSSAAGTLQPAPTQALEIPQLCLAGCLPEQHNAIVNLDLTSAAPAPGGGAYADFTAWPEFHNGVAAGTICLVRLCMGPC